MTRVEVLAGDCLEVMANLEENTIDAVVTDPPYGIEFMGRGWDKFRVDDPGTNRHRGDRAGSQGEAGPGDGSHPARAGVAVAYGGVNRPSTSRCTGCGKRDQRRNDHSCGRHARWVHELIDPFAAPPGMLAFEQWVRQWGMELLRICKPGAHLVAFGATRTHHRLMSGLEEAGWEIRDCGVWMYRSGFPKSHNLTGQWTGWGTALKPAIEPWVLCRKPLSETSVARNVDRWGVGALNIDATRIPMDDDEREAFRKGSEAWARRDDRAGEGRKVANVYGTYGATDPTDAHVAGRWPANVATLDLDPDLRHFRILGGQVADFAKAGAGEKPWNGSHGGRYRCDACGRGQYHASASGCPKCGGELVDDRQQSTLHPTVKPLALIRHLVRLVTPPQGIVLDPFAGTGTTGEAALIEGFGSVLIEREEDYRQLIEARLTKPIQPTLGDTI